MSRFVGNSGRWDGPWSCPYCDYKSPRKGNARMHIDNRHKGADNPYYRFPVADYPNLRKRVSFKDSTTNLSGLSGVPATLPSESKPVNEMVTPVLILDLSQKIEATSDLEFLALLPSISKRISDDPKKLLILRYLHRSTMT